ncbi:MDR family MFS transporter [Paenibacillus piri]|uniref:DHA2 family efflux MFS transporter permease subunit n=1 Tax=Paenibacillus piri TaxID=2547395 RepID=A0A4R5KRI7_9BACL|nr:MDR family MFS transporter [Paenibacillus piri]TDF98002.1 DHA2 family efflux MFS transporter permease subunit [Paenibacillus piri]
MATVHKKKIGWVLAGLLLGILMAAMDNTIVATAMGTIVADLGGFDHFVWVTSAYMVTMMAGTPIFGKLSDMYGRKIFFITGLALFIVGSILCAAAQSIVQLSIFRAVQGIGGGAILPIAFTIIFDVFPPEKRGKVSGLFGAVFGVSSIFGPLLGAFLTETLNWRWVFYINLPLGVLSLLLIALCYYESQQHAKQKIDWAGAITLVTAIVSLLLALELGGNTYDWNSGIVIGLFAAFLVSLALFLRFETKAAEPIISFAMFKNRLFATSNLAALFIGVTFISATVYIPIFVQGVLGGSATNSGGILTPMMLGSVAGSQVGGYLTTKTSYRNIMLGASLLIVAGIGWLGLLTPDTTRMILILGMILTGFGVGFSFSVLSMAAIHPFEMWQRGSATSANRFMISLGTTLGITGFGIIQRNFFTGSIGGSSGEGIALNGGNWGSANNLLTAAGRAQIPHEVLDNMVRALSSSIADTFLWALVPAVLAAATICMMSNERLSIPVNTTMKSSGRRANLD